jgi:CBS domain-containing protein
MLVSHIIREKGNAVVSVAAEATLAEAAKLLARHRIGAVLILDSHGAPLGILSERDIVSVLAQLGAAALARIVGSCMTSPVMTCEESDTIEDLMERMTHGRFRHLPVVQRGRVVGLVSIGDVVKTRIEETVREAQALKEYIAAG